MTDLEVLQDSINAALQAYICLTDDEKDNLNSDYEFYKNLDILRRIVARAVTEEQNEKGLMNE